MQTVEFSIRNAEVGDAPAIAAIFQALGWPGRIASLTPEAASARVAQHLQMCQRDDSHSIWVAQDRSGQVLGYVAVHWLPYLFLAGPEGYVSELFVHPDAAQNGIGTRLLETVRAEAGRRGCSRLSLLNFRQRESYRRGFYAGRGWEERDGAVNFVYDLARE